MKESPFIWKSKVNGKERELAVPPAKRLVSLLREDLKLTGTKVSCEIGRCGACMVLMNGKAVNACLVMAFQSSGKEIVTIEGITGSIESAGSNGLTESTESIKSTEMVRSVGQPGFTDREPHPIQRAFLEEGGFQCGYCTPGMIIATKALLDENPHPDRAQIEEALSGNLCRCTGYGAIIRAVENAAN
jgi:carbon-monoxide dehydrogenase small subunit